jgi:hypothetical protein
MDEMSIIPGPFTTPAQGGISESTINDFAQPAD